MRVTAAPPVAQVREAGRRHTALVYIFHFTYCMYSASPRRACCSRKRWESLEGAVPSVARVRGAAPHGPKHLRLKETE